MMPGFNRRWLRRIAEWLAASTLGSLVAVVATYAIILNDRPDLSVWHLADLDEEFTEDSAVSSFADYLALEDRLFEQLDSLVYAVVPGGPEHALNRYSRGSLSDPGRWPKNWNRSIEMRQSQPAAAVLLLHGLSDSPYSMRALAESLHENGATVLALRVPGHGTVPAGLVDVRWQDMAAAVRLAAQHLDESTGGAPLYLVGYSNGGALAINYALAGLADSTLPPAAGLVLLSPEIGVSGVAAFAVWQGRLGHFLGLEKLAWNDLLPEFDPFKYGSFAVNAGDLAHRITRHLQQRLGALETSGGLEALPPILAFQSGVDATVTASALVQNLFDRLPAAGHELVLFDINRRAGMSTVLRQDPRAVFDPLLSRPDRQFALTFVTNESADSRRTMASTAMPGVSAPVSEVLVGEWPADVYSLSHVALPFSPDDPVYGGPLAAASPGIQLGNLAMRGERGVLRISGTDALRLRWNPFFGYVEQRILEFADLQEPE